MCSTDDDPDPMGIFIKDDETASLDCEGCYIPMGSVVVKPGCTLTAFEVKPGKCKAFDESF